MNAIEAISPRRATAAGRTLSQPVAYALSAAIIGAALFASATPSPLYETYARLWGFSSVVLTLVYATYAIGVLAALLLAGRISDVAGRRPVLAIALGALLGATVLYMMADSVAWLFAARGVQGLATGLALGTASAALLDFHPRQDPEGVGLTNGVVSAAGLGFGALASSAAVQLLPAPRLLPYVAVFVLFAVDFVGVMFMPEPVAARSRPRLTPQRPYVPPSARRPFIVAALAVISAYSIGGLFFALGPELSGRVFGTGNHVVTGLSLFLLAAVGSLSQLAYGRRAAWLGATAGSGALAFGMAWIVLAAAENSAAALIIGSVVGGAGFGLAFLGSLRALSAQIPPTHRAGVMSAFFIAAYAALSIPAVLAGFAVKPLGLEATFEILGSAVALLALAVGVQAWRTRPRPEGYGANLTAETRRAPRRSRHFRPRRSASAAVRGPGDLQPADRLLHIAHASGERIPDRYLCGAPVRRLIARIQPGTGPGGGGVCATCAELDAASPGGDARNADDGEQRPYDGSDQP